MSDAGRNFEPRQSTKLSDAASTGNGTLTIRTVQQHHTLTPAESNAD
jgi:hypothetical protein